MGYRVVDEAFPNIVINRRMKTQKKLGKILYKMVTEEDFEMGIKQIQRETGAGAQAISANLGPYHKMVKNKKVYQLEDWLKEDIKKIADSLRDTKCFRSGLSRDKKKLINVMFYILYLHNAE